MAQQEENAGSMSNVLQKLRQQLKKTKAYWNKLAARRTGHMMTIIRGSELINRGTC